ncbi:tRNA pseudouridine(38-40) synthase TruA [Puia dinghuensis]|uniref:tRNA pseudouridine synthase A n=1 Tax=Puia dinghuensis TaxID=1792502 RepID=A0A8J2UDM7_9BACT|nr:tRNA pseudouridine(38-40) synthase TruA [Puia dinghuensis]GGB01715.1 tRNA pseudouridine synthase A [Puia dinghuensis]
MPRYFLELSYKGNNYSGFQIQDNANSIQQEVEKALAIFFRQRFDLTSSSRTDAGVHALQNFFHFDYEEIIDPRVLYNINAILPPDIVLKNLYPVAADAHCRFDATSREYRYYLYRVKNPFLADRAWFYPYTLDREKLDAAARIIPAHHDFTTFSKRNTQVKTFLCTIYDSVWEEDGQCLVYRVRANRFLRGMVRGLVSTMVQVGRGKLSLEELDAILGERNNQLADFTAPGHGLFLHQVTFPVSVLDPHAG